MEKLTYKQAFDKITEAYIKEEIKPMRMDFCFCGTLACEVKERDIGSYWDDERYSEQEYLRMEIALMKGLGAKRVIGGNGWHIGTERPYDADYEERLFAGMCAALDVLKSIHKERGEEVESVPVFKKRFNQLQ